MEISELKLLIRDLVKGYIEDDKTSRVVAWDGKLDVRPEYQREFVYDNKQRSAVINTILHKFPLNIMYFVDRQDGTYEVLDGQQRIISICQYYNNKFSVQLPRATGGFDDVNFPNLDGFGDYVERFLDYPLQVYICEGTEDEKLDWFQIINIAGEELSTQEIRNALYHCAWLTDTKSAFSRRNCNAHKHYGKYMGGDYIRQKYLETVFKWAADAEGITSKKDVVSTYMKAHRQDKNADALWRYFEDIFTWVELNFGKYNPAMKAIEWGLLYNAHKDDNLDPDEIQRLTQALLSDTAVKNLKGVFEYVLTGCKDTKLLSIRIFDDSTKKIVYKQQTDEALKEGNSNCPLCALGNDNNNTRIWDSNEMDADHVTAWSKGGATDISNCQMLCKTHNRAKGNK